MLSITELKKDTLIQLADVPYRVVDYQHTQLGRGGAVVKTKLKSLVDGSLISKTFKGKDRVEPARLRQVDMQLLYADKSHLQLMDSATYEQTTVPLKVIGAKLNYLVEGSTVTALIFNNQVLDIELPTKIRLKVSQTEPGVKGDTTGTAFKPAKLETKSVVMVPLFIKPNDYVWVDTRTGKYLNRA